MSSRFDFTDIQNSRKPFRYNIRKVEEAYANEHPEKLQSMIERYNKAQRERATKAREAMLRRMGDQEYIKSWGTKNKPDHPLAEGQNLEGYKKFINQQPIKMSNPRGEFPPSYKERKAAREAKKAAFLQQLRSVYPPESTDKDLMLYYKKGKEKYDEQRGYKKRKLTDEEKQERINRSMIHMTRPAAVIKYADEVQKYDGKPYPDKYRITDFKPGDYPQFDPKIRDKATKMFAELTGTLGIMPTYDPKLASYESAKRIYPEEDYDIQYFDMDEDDLTAGTLIIRKKYGFDENGEYMILPEDQWEIIAVNGYRLQNPSEASQIRRLKDIDYYTKNPTVEARRATPFSSYVKDTFKKTNAKILTVMKDIVRLYINTYYPNSSFMRMYIPDEGSGDQYLQGVYFYVSPVVLNTIIARAARIWAMELYRHANKEQFEGDATREAAIFREYVNAMDSQPPNTKNTLYKHFLLEPVLENYLLRHKKILKILEDHVNGLYINAKEEVRVANAQQLWLFVNYAVKGFININDNMLDYLLAQAGKSFDEAFPISTFEFTDKEPGEDDIEIAMAPLSDKKGKDGKPSALYSKRGITYWGTKYIQGAQVSQALPPPSRVLPAATESGSSSSSSSSMSRSQNQPPPSPAPPAATDSGSTPRLPPPSRIPPAASNPFVPTVSPNNPFLQYMNKPPTQNPFQSSN